MANLKLLQRLVFFCDY